MPSWNPGILASFSAQVAGFNCSSSPFFSFVYSLHAACSMGSARVLVDPLNTSRLLLPRFLPLKISDPSQNAAACRPFPGAISSA